MLLIIFADRATEVEDLKSAHAQAKEQAWVSQAAADKAAADLEAEQVTRQVAETWEADRESLLDPERYYGLRREHLPMPWDQG